MKQFKIVVIGSGFGLYGHLPSLLSIPEFKVTAICGKKTERLINYCSSVGLGNIYSQWKEMIDKEKPDAISLAVIPKYQYDIAYYALKNKIGVFAEKPLAATLAEAEILNSTAQQMHLPNMVNFIFQETNVFQKTKQLLNQNKIGKVLNINVDWCFVSYDIKNQVNSWKTDNATGGGVLPFFGSHVLYYLSFFLGDFAITNAAFQTSSESLGGGYTTANLNCLFQSGATASIYINCSAVRKNQHSITFSGEKGNICIINSMQTVFTDFHLFLNNHPVHYQPEEIISNVQNLDERVPIVRKMHSHFLTWLKTGKSMTPNFFDGYKVQLLIDQALNFKTI